LRVNLEGVDATHFTHLFIDEAAQATEPESLIPLSVVVDPEPGNRKVEVALVGDPRQLHPAVYSEKAAAAGLERSWMERLLQRPVSCLGGGREHLLGPDMVGMEEWLKYSFQHDGQEQLSVFLTLNYRGHPSFLMMPSVLFYFDKLQGVDHKKENSQGETYWCDKLRSVEKLSRPVQVLLRNGLVVPEEARFRRQTTWPVHFREVVGKDKAVATFTSNSWLNMEEATVVVEIVLTLARHGVSTQSIGVMAPFRGQVVLIRNELRKVGLAGVNVGTIEDYQAVERDVIILSCTRSSQAFVEHDIQHRMGVFRQPKRANVAMTRAEHLFIVVSNRRMLD
jgi:superfamily I DNA and/or RNA helicase